MMREKEEDSNIEEDIIFFYRLMNQSRQRLLRYRSMHFALPNCIYLTVPTPESCYSEDVLRGNTSCVTFTGSGNVQIAKHFIHSFRRYWLERCFVPRIKSNSNSRYGRVGVYGDYAEQLLCKPCLLSHQGFHYVRTLYDSSWYSDSFFPW